MFDTCVLLIWYMFDKCLIHVCYMFDKTNRWVKELMYNRVRVKELERLIVIPGCVIAPERIIEVPGGPRRAPRGIPGGSQRAPRRGLRTGKSVKKLKSN